MTPGGIRTRRAISGPRRTKSSSSAKDPTGALLAGLLLSLCHYNGPPLISASAPLPVAPEKRGLALDPTLDPNAPLRDEMKRDEEGMASSSKALPLSINHLLCENRRTASRIGEDGLMQRSAHIRLR